MHPLRRHPSSSTTSHPGASSRITRPPRRLPAIPQPPAASTVYGSRNWNIRATLMCFLVAIPVMSREGRMQMRVMEENLKDRRLLIEKDVPGSYEAVPGSKRPYSAMDDPPRYADAGSRHSRARVEYGVSGGSCQYDNAYDERIARSHVGYGGGGGGRSSLSGKDSHGLYSSRQGMAYGGGSASGGDAGLYSSSFGNGNSYLSRGSDVGGSSYSSLYSGRNLGNNGYMGGTRHTMFLGEGLMRF